MLVIKNSLKRETGSKMQHANIQASRAVAAIICTTLGPRSPLKKLLDAGEGFAKLYNACEESFSVDGPLSDEAFGKARSILDDMKLSNVGLEQEAQLQQSLLRTVYQFLTDGIVGAFSQTCMAPLARLTIFLQVQEWRANWLHDEDRSIKPRKKDGFALSFGFNQTADTEDDRADGSRNSGDFPINHKDGTISIFSGARSLVDTWKKRVEAEMNINDAKSGSSQAVAWSSRPRLSEVSHGGYIASWVVKFLLSKGYIVHGTVRDPSDEKNSHLKKLEKALENLQLFKTDLLDYEGLCAAFAGCSGVFHVASPVHIGPISNPEVELIEPAVVGTRNVSSACEKAKVKKVVVVSSTGAVAMTPNRPKDRPMDEECWSDLEYCKANQNYYCLAKTIAESEALEHTKKSELNIVTVCLSFVFGPMLQSTMNGSCLLLLSFMKDGGESVKNIVYPVVDVRDVAESILLVYENPDAVGRYICSAHSIQAQALAEKLKSMYPNCNYPKSCIEDEET
ncbi:cinnamoyl-CoA reductase 2-like [Vitis riparia]|uniref:cinnamoyl-CoA reductase 2-like n=1 Tax=Vitis riparia TaxID=96939 RepID=UPI00155A43B2|nr:cinnamoyl-CoA reductase 2-like [Vitis riparia]